MQPLSMNVFSTLAWLRTEHVFSFLSQSCIHLYLQRSQTLYTNPVLYLFSCPNMHFDCIQYINLFTVALHIHQSLHASLPQNLKCKGLKGKEKYEITYVS
jgi:hypothetical protein